MNCNPTMPIIIPINVPKSTNTKSLFYGVGAFNQDILDFSKKNLSIKGPLDPKQSS